jgi:hypothetical protein
MLAPLSPEEATFTSADSVGLGATTAESVAKLDPRTIEASFDKASPPLTGQVTTSLRLWTAAAARPHLAHGWSGHSESEICPASGINRFRGESR